MSKIYVGDLGTEVSLDTGVDLASATATKIRVTKPDRTFFYWDAEVVDDTKLSYITSMEASEWDMSGTWRFQAYVILPYWGGHGETLAIPIFKLGE